MRSLDLSSHAIVRFLVCELSGSQEAKDPVILPTARHSLPPVSIPAQRKLVVALFQAEGLTLPAPVSAVSESRGSNTPTVRPAKRSK